MPTGTARISKDGLYRYVLTRQPYLTPAEEAGDKQITTVTFVMLNPSTADHTKNDPTIVRCMRFADDWGYARLRVLNLYAFRATSPADLKQLIKARGEAAAVGPDNDALLAIEPSIADKIVVAWGQNAPPRRAQQVLEILRGHQSSPELYCLGITSTGYPRHPLYVAAATRPFPYRPVQL